MPCSESITDMAHPYMLVVEGGGQQVIAIFCVCSTKDTVH